MSAASAMMWTRLTRSRASCDSRNGCGATPTSSTSSAGFAPTTTRWPGARPVPASTDWTCTACTPRSRPCSSISTRLIRRAHDARLVANTEAYYRAMFGSRVSSWNLRDGHMAETLDALDAYLSNDHGPAKIVVWAHNSHLGDARATELSRSGELNLGQLVRERHGHDAVLVGFSTYGGTVTAASDWDAAAERKIVRPALPGSYESLFHEMGGPNFMLDLAAGSDTTLRRPKLQRAIGVIYRPETERQSHYFHASLRRQFDALLHYDVTRAVEPLESTALWTRGEAPETFPSAL